MKTTPRYLLATGLLALAPLAAHAKIERTVEKTFTVQAGGKLHLETQGGSITVTRGSDSVVKVVAREKIRADSDSEADNLLKKLDLTIEQSGNDVSATSKYDSQPIGFHWGSWPPVQVDFVVTVPASYGTDLHTSGGGITVGDLNAPVFARTSGGGIKLGKIGADIDAHTSGGSVSLESSSGEVKLRTSGGNITVGRVDGPASLETSGGSIRIESVVGSIHASTSGGSIRAGLKGPLKSDCVLSTSGGSVNLAVEKTASFQLDASTSGGSVDAGGLTITLEKSNRSRSRLAGSVNGGGPLLKLRSSGGNIDLTTM